MLRAGRGNGYVPVGALVGLRHRAAQERRTSHAARQVNGTVADDSFQVGIGAAPPQGPPVRSSPLTETL